MADLTQDRRKRVPPAAQLMPSVNPFLGLLPPRYWRRAKDFFMYSADYLPLNASASLNVDILINNDSDFLIMAGVRTVTSSDNLTQVTFFPATVTITDRGSGRNIMDRAVHLENLFGTAQLPQIWPFPKIIPAGATLSTLLQSLDTVNNRNVRISYLGMKIFFMAEPT